MGYRDPSYSKSEGNLGIEWLAGLMVLAFAAYLPAELPAQESMELVISVMGEVTTPGRLTLTLEPGKNADRAIRVYSEPSHTLLALVIDRAFKAEPEFSSWEESFLSSGRPRVTVETALPHARPRLTIPARPERDDVISVWIFGTWPDGTVEDREAAAAKVGNESFAFSTSMAPSKHRRKQGGAHAQIWEPGGWI